jgi:hypothetical protein
LKEQLTDYAFFRLKYITDNFLKMNEEGLTLQGKQLRIFAVSDKI